MLYNIIPAIIIPIIEIIAIIIIIIGIIIYFKNKKLLILYSGLLVLLYKSLLELINWIYGLYILNIFILFVLELVVIAIVFYYLSKERKEKIEKIENPEVNILIDNEGKEKKSLKWISKLKKNLLFIKPKHSGLVFKLFIVFAVIGVIVPLIFIFIPIREVVFTRTLIFFFIVEILLGVLSIVLKKYYQKEKLNDKKYLRGYEFEFKWGDEKFLEKE